MGMAVVTLKKGEGRLLKSGGMWIFDNEIDTIMGSFENGHCLTARAGNLWRISRCFPIVRIYYCMLVLRFQSVLALLSMIMPFCRGKVRGAL